MAKVFIILTGLLLAGCEASRDFRALTYCVIHQNDSNRRCN